MSTTRLESSLRHRASRDRLLRDVRDAALRVESSVWLVGGYVRCAALHRPSDDLDLVAVRGVARMLAEIRRTWRTRGFRFQKRGITTWRFSVHSRGIDLVDATRRGLEKDLRRRELTINAIAFDLLRGRLHDPLHGLADLAAGRLRLPRSGVLREDPVRALRAARFLAQLPGFELEARALREARSCRPGLRVAAAERIGEELDKLLDARSPQRGLRLLDDRDLLHAVLPDLAPLRNCAVGRERPDVWSHTVDAVALSASASRLPAATRVRRSGELRLLRWALLLHDISKPDTLDHAPDGRPTFHGHEVLGARRADRVLQRLRMSRSDRRRVCRLVRFHLRPGHLADAGAPTRGLRRLVLEAGDDLPLLVLHAACDARASGGPEMPQRWRRLRRVLTRLLELHESREVSPSRPLIDGREVMGILGLAPGPEVGAILSRVRRLQDEGKLSTHQEALRFLARIKPRTRRATRSGAGTETE